MNLDAAMQAAIEQAEQVKGRTYPNPPVGAVILDRDGQTVLSENDDYGDGLSSHITWTAPLSGTYFVSVSGYATETGSFTVSVTANTGTAGGATGDPCNGGLTLASRSDVISYRPRGQNEQNAMCSWEISSAPPKNLARSSPWPS